jgi:hypothetical protein
LCLTWLVRNNTVTEVEWFLRRCELVSLVTRSISARHSDVQTLPSNN